MTKQQWEERDELAFANATAKTVCLCGTEAEPTFTAGSLLIGRSWYPYSCLKCMYERFIELMQMNDEMPRFQLYRVEG